MKTDLSGFQRNYISASLAEYAPDKNLVIGPNSAELQLALLACGTAGASFRQIAQALGADADTPDDFLRSDYLTGLLRRRDDLNRAGETAGTWVRSRTGLVVTQPVLPAFAEHLERFGADALPVRAEDDITAMVNVWAAKATATPSTPGGLINPLLNTPLDPLTVFVALTADAFELLFAWPFDPDLTWEAPFTSADGRRQNCDLMHQNFSWDEGAAYFARADGTELAVLPYGHAADFALRLTKVPLRAAGGPEAIAEWYEAQHASPVTTTAMAFDLAMPRADIGGQRETGPTRGRLGIEAIYSDLADFAGMLPHALPGDPYIGQSIEAASLKINEIKTEGAVIQMEDLVAAGLPPPCPSLRLDSTYLVEVVVGNGVPAPDQHDDILLFAVVNRPGRLPPPASAARRETVVDPAPPE